MKNVLFIWTTLHELDVFDGLQMVPVTIEDLESKKETIPEGKSDY